MKKKGWHGSYYLVAAVYLTNGWEKGLKQFRL